MREEKPLGCARGILTILYPAKQCHGEECQAQAVINCTNSQTKLGGRAWIERLNKKSEVKVKDIEESYFQRPIMASEAQIGLITMTWPPE